MGIKSNKRESFSNVLKRISKDDLVNYCDSGKSKSEVSEHFNLGYGLTTKLLNYYGISLEWKSKNRDLLNKISREDFYNYYIKENHTIEECMSHYNLFQSNIIYLIKSYNINKDRKEASKRVLETKEQLYGTSGYNNREKAKQTLFESYGVYNSSQVEGAQEKRKNSLIHKYGSIDNFYNERKEKIISTMQDKEGVDYPSQSNNWNSILEANMTEKYGSLQEFYNYRGHKALKENLNEKFESLYRNKEESISYLSSKGNKPTCVEIADEFQIKLSYVYQWIEKFELQSYLELKPLFRSSYEDALLELFKGFNVEVNTRKIFDDHKELDIYIPELNLGIEFNGTYWHSDIFLDRKYHFIKSKNAQEKGIRLIHIYEYEWKDPLKREKMISMLKIASGRVESKIYARNCEIREITNKEAKPFNELNHLQGHRDAKVTYGLFYKNKLVQLMSFSKNKKYEWEIIRGCPASNNIVVGGVSKLFNHFKNIYNPKEVFSYCDFNKFDGKGYESLGMKFIGYTGPDMKWIIGDKVFNRQPKKHAEMKSKANAAIYGAGSKKYLYVKEN